MQSSNKIPLSTSILNTQMTWYPQIEKAMQGHNSHLAREVWLYQRMNGQPKYIFGYGCSKKYVQWFLISWEEFIEKYISLWDRKRWNGLEIESLPTLNSLHSFEQMREFFHFWREPHRRSQSYSMLNKIEAVSQTESQKGGEAGRQRHREEERKKGSKDEWKGRGKDCIISGGSKYSGGQKPTE